MNSVELFAGAGGLAMGMARAGFHHDAVIELDTFACETFRLNQKLHAPLVEGWPLFEIDARRFDYAQLDAEIAVVSGGPPCQPFSISGKHGAQRDGRNMFPEAVRAVRELEPKAFIFENVKGLVMKHLAPYFSYILLQLQHPELTRKKGERWIRHRSRLESFHSGNSGAPTYNVLFNLLNAADYGVPQKRERVFITGFKSDLAIEWHCPEPTHSEDALIAAKWIDGTYWKEHGLKRPRNTPDHLRGRVEKIEKKGLHAKARWRTVRDALRDLPDPERSNAVMVQDHIFTPGARTYDGHTGSPLDEPAKTLKAGLHGVPGGENMMIKDDGTVRYFTVRECARLQTFPDEYVFSSSWTRTMRQLGNAVPVSLAEVVARSIARSLERA